MYENLKCDVSEELTKEKNSGTRQYIMTMKSSMRETHILRVMSYQKKIQLKMKTK